MDFLSCHQLFRLAFSSSFCLHFCVTIPLDSEVRLLPTVSSEILGLVILLNWCWLCCIFSRSTRKSASQNLSWSVIYGWSLFAATDHKLHLFCEFAVLLSDIGLLLLLIASNSSPPIHTKQPQIQTRKCQFHWHKI
jgi:hypothetical protein